MYPLELLLCESCFHLQLSISVNQDILFRDYSYVSGTTKTLSQYFHNFFKYVNDLGLNERRVLEIASNDGSLLKMFEENGWVSLGVDPALNLIPQSIANGVITIPHYFSDEISNVIRNDFSLIVAMNVFAHTPKPYEMLKAMKNCLSETGLIAIQTSQANMIPLNQFDTVYHEHISFFNISSMRAILSRLNLYLVGLQIVPIHGDSYIWWISKDSRMKINNSILDERFILTRSC